MSKRSLIIASLVLLVVAIGFVVIEAATPQSCYTYCRKYDNIDQFLSCYDGCMHANQ